MARKTKYWRLKLLNNRPLFRGRRALSISPSKAAQNPGKLLEALEPRLLFNAAPVAQPDLLVTRPGEAIVVDMLALNDQDADGDALSVSWAGAADSGQITDHGDGTWTYLPGVGFTGVDSFSYTVTDGQGGSASGQAQVAVNQGVDVEAARDALLAGVTTLANPTQPGYALAYGPTAFSVANYNGTQQTMIAAAGWGDGRVVALPDHQWLNMGAFGDTADTGRFYNNSIGWLAESGSKSIRIAVLDPGTLGWLQGQGYTNAVQTSLGQLASGLDGADVFVASWLGSNVSQSALDTIAGFVRGGGGLLVSDYGPGYNWWWGKPISQAPGNLLLREAGIGFANDYTNNYTVQRAVGQINAQTLIDILDDDTGYSSAQLDQAGHLLAGLGDVLGANDTLLAQIDARFWDRVGSIIPTPATPVSDTFDQALLTREMQLIRDLPPEQVTAHRTAAGVYGAIPAGAQRLTNHPVTIDTDKTGMVATGLYAAPGELVTVAVPSALAGQGYTIKISGHSDSIAGRSSWRRMPFGIQRVYALDSTNVQIASAFGGQIYIDLGGQAAGAMPGLGQQTLTIDGAIAAPMFVLGQTTDQQWIDTIRDHPGPYAEMVTNAVAFSVPSAWIRDLDNPTALMQAWQDAVAFQDWVGGFENLRTGPDRINVDVQISVGLLHAGYPIQGPTSYGSKLVDLAALQESGDWGYFHELGHEMQRHPELGWGWDNPWTFGGDVEVTVNIFANAALEQFAPDTPTNGWGYSAHPDQVMGRATTEVANTGNPGFDSKNPYPFYFQLADGPWGWQGYRDVLSTYVDDAQNNPGNLPSGAQAEKDQWLIRWSQQTGYDMTRYMVDQWGLEVSSSALSTVAAMNLPDWLPLATTLGAVDLQPGNPVTLDLGAAGLGLDGVATLVAVGNPGNGTLTDLGNGRYTYTPNAGHLGDDRFAVTYRTSVGNEQTFNIDLDTPYTNPVAVDDTATTPAGTPLVIDVLANDLVSDAPADIDSLTQPDHGSVAESGDGTLTYAPDLGFVGTDTFTYTLIDTSGNTATATVQVLVTATATQDPITYPAEYADYGGSTTGFSNYNPGYHDQGYVNFSRNNGYLQFNNVQGGSGGTTTLDFRFALGNSPRTGLIIVNGQAQPITFPRSGSWADFDNFLVDVQLNPGATNTIRLESTGQDLAHIDELTLTPNAWVLPGDANLDGTVDNADLTLVINHWGQAVDPIQPGDPDVDDDGLVGASDMQLVLRNMGSQAPPVTDTAGGGPSTPLVSQGPLDGDHDLPPAEPDPPIQTNRSRLAGLFASLAERFRSRWSDRRADTPPRPENRSDNLLADWSDPKSDRLAQTGQTRKKPWRFRR